MEALAGLGTAANVIAVVDLAARTTSALAVYARDVAQSSSVRSLLAQEALLLEDLLQRLLARVKTAAHDPAWLRSNTAALTQLQKAHQDLTKLLNINLTDGSLKKEDRLRSLLTATKWPFSKTDAYSILERVARLQQHANSLLLADQTTALEQLSAQVSENTRLSTRSGVIRWLSPLKMSRTHHALLASVPVGSAQWFLGCDKFGQWQSSTDARNLLWCSGIPGAGKTVVASIVARHLKDGQSQAAKQDHALAVVFLKHDDQEQSTENIFGSILSQLVETRTSLSATLEDLYHSAGTPPAPPTLETIQLESRSITQTFSKVSIIIDGLDECSDGTRWKVMEGVRSMGKDVHILVTSRFRVSIAEELSDFERQEIAAQPSDIKLFVDTELQINRNLQRVLKKQPQLQEEITTCVIGTAQGMFLLVKLHLELLARSVNLPMKLFRQQLYKLPTTLHSSYDEVMHRVRSQDTYQVELAIKSIAWVANAVRPLTLNELQQALAMDTERRIIDDEMLLDGSSISGMCEGLLVVDEDMDSVELVHYSAKDYLQTNGETLFPNFNQTITECCVACLTMEPLAGMSIVSLFQDFPLACYAAQYLGVHANRQAGSVLCSSLLETIRSMLLAQDTRRTITTILDTSDLLRAGFFSLPNHAQPTTRQLHDARDTDTADPIRNAVMALHVAISMGLTAVAAMLIRSIPEIDATNDAGRTALDLALEQRLDLAVELLIQNGARIDLREPKGQEILLLVAENNWRNVFSAIYARSTAAGQSGELDAKLLLAAMGDDDAAFQKAVRCMGPDLSARHTSTSVNCLFILVEMMKHARVTLLLTHGVDCNVKDAIGNTAMHRAAKKGDKHMIRTLLQNHAAVDIYNDQMLTPWSSTLKLGRHDVSDMLLAAGADANTTGWHGASEIYAASAVGDNSIVSYMIKSGTDPSIKTDYDWVPLHWASHNGHLKTVNMLIEAGAELNSKSDQGLTPLDLATDAKQAAVITLLQSHGAMRSKNLSGPTATPSSAIPIGSVAPGANPRNQSPPLATSTPSTCPVTTDEKLTLSFDQPYHSSLEIGQFIYLDKADHGPQQESIFYQLSHPLSSSTKCLGIRRAADWVRSDEYPLNEDKFIQADCLYNIRTVDESQLQMHLEPVTATPQHLVPVIVRRSWDGSWSVYQSLKSAANKDGSTVLPLYRVEANLPQLGDLEAGWEWIRAEDGLVTGRNYSGRPHSLRFDASLTHSERDLLVACWVCKLRRATIAGSA